MGQTVSVNSTNRAIYISSLDDAVSRIAVSNSRVSIDKVRPEPGWSVEALPAGQWVLHHRPKGISTAYDGFSQTLIATLLEPISDAAVYTLYNDTDHTDYTDDYIQTPATDMKIPIDSMTLVIPALVLVDRDAPIILSMKLYNAQPGPITVTVSDPMFTVEKITSTDYVLKQSVPNYSPNRLHETFTPIIMVRNGNMDQIINQITVRFVQSVHLTAPVRIAVNYMDRIRLSIQTFETQETLQALSGPVTHVMMRLSDNVTVNGRSGLVTLSRTELTSAVVQTSDKISKQISYWLSMDGGLVYPVKGILRVGPMPCFPGTAVVCVSISGYRMQWKQVRHLQPNEQILDANGKWHSVRRIVRSEPVDVVMVQLPMHCLGHNRPNKMLMLTTNHRVMAPDSHGHVRNVPAGQMPSINSFIQHINVYRTRLYHIETHEYTFILLNNVPVETFRHAPIFRNT